MDLKLLDYQIEIIRKLVNNKASWLTLKMGLGKTVCALTTIDLWLKSNSIKKVLIIAPLLVCKLTWFEEIKKFRNFNHLSPILLNGTAKAREKKLTLDNNIFIISKDSIYWLIKYYEKKPFPFDCLIIDESSTFKSYTSKRFKALRKVAKDIKHKILLTGTPMPNGYLDIWAQVCLLDDGERLGASMTKYRDEYFIPRGRSKEGFYYDYRLKSEHCKTLIDNKIKDLIVGTNEITKLPERVNNIILLELEPKVLKEYKIFKKEKITKDKLITASSAGVLVNKLLQYASGNILDSNENVVNIHNTKLEYLKHLIEELNEPIIVYTIYQADKLAILDNIKDSVLFDSSSNNIKESWDKGLIKVLVAHPQSIGYGLNMQYGGHIIVWYSLPYNLDFYQQANARLYRTGQDKTTIFYYLLSKDTIDEKVYKVLNDKAYTQEMFLQDIIKGD